MVNIEPINMVMTGGWSIIIITHIITVAGLNPETHSCRVFLQELQQYLAEVHPDSAAARGRSLQVRFVWGGVGRPIPGESQLDG